MFQNTAKTVCLLLLVILVGGIITVYNSEFVYGKEKQDNERDKLEVIVNVNIKELEKKDF